MNEHVALGWPSLNLAREMPFGLAGTHVRPAALEVETAGQVTQLEPRVMKVLVALHRSRGQPVSRDELIDICWNGRIVTEGALNRCVAQLRKALSCNPRIRLDTIPTVGYRLQASAEVHRVAPPAAVAGAPAVALDEPAPAPERRLPRNLILGGLAAVAAAAAGLWFLLPKPVDWTAAGYHPLTAEQGVETHPALSPSGEQIVYSRRPDASVRRDLYIRGVEQGTPVRITTDPGDDISAVWSPRGDRLAFIRVPASGPCTVMVTPVPAGAERSVARCQQATYTRVSWLDDQTLVIGDRPTTTDIWRIRAIDIRTGAARDLTTPDPATLGDSDPAASPDGRYVVFRRSIMHGADDLFLIDVRTGRERALTTDGWKAAGYVWSADGRHIFYSSNRGGEFGLWTIDTRTGDPPKRISLGLGQVTFSRMSIDGRNRLAVEAPRGRTNLAWLGAGGTLTPITTEAGTDWDPEAAADGTVAYVSNRSGAPELWVTRPDGQSVRLTSIVGSYLNAPAWSPDGQSLAFVAVKGRRSDIYTVGRDGSRLRSITWDGFDKLDPVWGPGGRLYYLERQGTAYRLMELTPGAEHAAPVAAGAGFRNLRAGPDGRLYGLRAAGGTVVGLNGPAPPVRVGSGEAWTVGRDGIYVLTPRRDQAAAVWLHPWSGPARKLADVPDNGGGFLGTAPDGRVIVAQTLDDQVDLGLFDLATD
ncbi:winged helix-turn-helix domain-containing protein [Phenylobacterium sp. J367]|uniref:winged helix-turn-helix domain-containing protein n=1 Tax=Phenylobacterium sp. J367 TaxID=2898435 RepID=UPI0021512DD4|nr:winged helix-turn-helix domain-containing protein [Phenylobacterium sp. J367]MCR5879316.1 winged helix-turn-helix domain-containing protein [Phenylobacterium sp. J367]